MGRFLNGLAVTLPLCVLVTAAVASCGVYLPLWGWVLVGLLLGWFGRVVADWLLS